MAASIREINDIDVWLREWDLYEANLNKLVDKDNANLLELMEKYRKAQDKLQKDVTMQKKNLQAFETSLKSISKSHRANEHKEKFQEMSDKMNGVASIFNQLCQGLPRTASWFLRACIGEINVSLFSDKQRYKEVYEKFKLKTMMCAMALSFLNVFFVNTRFVDALFNAGLVWYYSSLTLQEQILRANGSRIRGWYVAHHYLSILVSGFLLIWPAGVSYQLFRTQFYCFVMYLTFVQFLQYYYQTGVLYKLHALGMGKSMDITQDGVRSWMIQRLMFLVPFLLTGYMFQLYNAYTLYWICIRGDCREWQVVGSAVLFTVIAFGNFCTLAVVLRQKIASRIRFPC